ncbi:MAG: haloalkane dehalogenase [Legionellales bacterium]|nr:haloalkane dehalogenase [Legionellales bacterium]
MLDSMTISSDFCYPSQFITVNGASMHYVEAGTGDPIVFVHGVPTSSYLWRNVIPHLTPYGRCIAVDLIGMGRSAKPDIEYRISDHIAYFEGFMETLGLTNVTLVLHAWGSVIGLDYAMRHSQKIKALAFMEAHLRPIHDWDMVALPVQELTQILQQPDGGYDVIMNSDYYVDRVMSDGVMRRLTDQEMEHYRAPFPTPKSRLPIWQYLQELPLGDDRQEALNIIQAYSKKLEDSSLPKLLLYAVPGFITTMDTVHWAKQQLPNLSMVDLGDALHYAQESKPHEFGEALAKWYNSI